MTEYLDRYPTMHEYAEGKRINPKLTDLISRADAIDALSRSIIYAWSTEQDLVAHSWAIRILQSLPSADAVQGWIPCSEELPSEDGNYLITVEDLRLGHIGEHTVTIADFYTKGKKWNSIVDVYACMPLPKPYKGGDTE